MKANAYRLVLLVLTLPTLLAGCSSTMQSTEFTNPDFNFAFVERVAVLPFENLSNDRQAGFRATRLTITELLATGAVDVVEPGEVLSALLQVTGTGPGRVATPNIQQIITLGQELDVQALVMGTVSQSENLRSGTVPVPAVTLDLRMVETETGAAVWATTASEKGSSVSSKVLGTGGQPIAETTRRCVQKALETLID